MQDPEDRESSQGLGGSTREPKEASAGRGDLLGTSNEGSPLEANTEGGDETTLALVALDP